MFLVRLWHCVTVESRSLNMNATGLPTMSLRPRTVALEPEIGTPVDSKRRMTAEGVQGANRGSDAREAKWPMLDEVNLVTFNKACLFMASYETHPSTSLAGLTASVTRRSSSGFT